jgi:Putative bacterial sensory transduction regulator
VVSRQGAAAAVESALADRELEWERTSETSYVVTLPGTHKLKTLCNLVVGDHALRVEAFVMRQPDENREELWAWLLQRNARMYGVAFSIDTVGDVYLVGRVPLHAVTTDEVDRLLGAVLTYADESFDSMLEIGFGSAIRREWAWRVSRGESLENLKAFAHFAAPNDGGGLPN